MFKELPPIYLVFVGIIFLYVVLVQFGHVPFLFACTPADVCYHIVPWNVWEHRAETEFVWRAGQSRFVSDLLYEFSLQ